MLRSLLIYLSKAAWARKIVTRWKFAWRAASRFVAGEKLDDALAAIRSLNEKGIYATLDHLGEHTDSPEAAQKAAQDVIDAINAIDRAGVKSNVSIKLTQMGLTLSENLCAENLRNILTRARECSMFVRVDMEDSPYVDRTLDMIRKMRGDYGLDNVGVVIQSYLYRSESDVRKLAQEHVKVRLCKGAYKEAAEVAFPKKSDVDSNYDRLAKILMDASLGMGAPVSAPDGRAPALPAIASHDPLRIEHAKAYAAQIGLPKHAVEFQMLNGIRRDLQDQLAKEGYPVRVYIPYGTEWYPYFMRRLAERPANVWFFISNFFRN